MVGVGVVVVSVSVAVEDGFDAGVIVRGRRFQGMRGKVRI